MIQSNYSSTGGPGNFELVARVAGKRGFDFWFREDGEPFLWTGPQHVE